MYETALWKGWGAKVLSQVTLEMSGVCKTKSKGSWTQEMYSGEKYLPCTCELVIQKPLSVCILELKMK